MTIRELHQIAEERRLLNAQIRSCAGLAGSFYPEPSCLTPGRYELVIDISSLPVVEYDELPEQRLIRPDDAVEA